MNQKDKHPDYKKLYSIVKERYKRTTHFHRGPHDETYYSVQVYESAKEIMKGLDLKVKRKQVLVAAILHDIGKIKLKSSKLFNSHGKKETIKEEWEKHPELGVPIIKSILKKEGHSKEFIDEVCEIARHHANRGDKLKNKSIEIKVLQDADLIADWGVAGFIRHFLYAGKFKVGSAFKGIKFICTHDIENKKREFKELNLKTSKELGKIRLKEEKEMVDKLMKTGQTDLFSFDE